MKIIFALFSLSLVLSSCMATYSETDKTEFDKQIKKFLKDKNKSCERTDSGLYYEIIEEGEGDYIGFQDIVNFKYKGTFLDGSVFDEQKEPVQYKVSALIGGWKEAMMMMKPNSKAFIVVPPHLGYGDKSLSDIPPHSILVFELEVTDVQ